MQASKQASEPASERASKRGRERESGKEREVERGKDIEAGNNTNEKGRRIQKIERAFVGTLSESKQTEWPKLEHEIPSKKTSKIDFQIVQRSRRNFKKLKPGNQNLECVLCGCCFAVLLFGFVVLWFCFV